MMKKISFLTLSLMIILAACSKKQVAQAPNRDRIEIKETEATTEAPPTNIENPDARVLTGELTKAELMTIKEPDFAWFRKGYDAYTPNQDAVNYLSNVASHIRIIAFGGTWCGDTQTQLPRFFKVTDEARIPGGQIALYGVDREKKCAAIDAKGYFIEQVPTFIVYYDGVEKGRIIETPKVTIEQDLMDILKK
jgi:thiol-disulfide isomerase/thioredoxin